MIKTTYDWLERFEKLLEESRQEWLREFDKAKYKKGQSK